MKRLVVAALLVPSALPGQWTNRYPKNAGYNHHVYLEGYELPSLTTGPVDAVAAPDGAALVVASRGWLWRVDLRTRVATRLTTGAGVDSRPAFSRDGRRIAFVRDDGRATAVIVRRLDTGEETEIDRGMALDPVFTADGAALIYANVTPDGDLDLYRHTFGTSGRTRLTEERGIELRPQVLADGRIVYMSKSRSSGDQVRLRSAGTTVHEISLMTGNLISQGRPSASPDGKRLVVSWPGAGGWELHVSSIDRPGVPLRLTAKPRGRPITPAWSHDGKTIWFSEADQQQRMRLWRVPSNGGAAQELPIARWDYGVPTARFTVRTLVASTPAPARLNVVDAAGHPVVPDAGMTRFDGQNGLHFFYSSGTIELEAPVGDVTVRASRGLSAPMNEQRIGIGGENRGSVDLTLTPMWNTASDGWFSGDHHFHLNYGGQFDLAPESLLLPMRAEDLDVGSPMLANLHNRFENQDHWGWRSPDARPIVAVAQEVRSHFLGHVGLLGTNDLFWPWIWGPGYEVHGRDDRTNSEPLLDARRQGGLGVYVHPTPHAQPFTEAGLPSIPIGLIPDAVLGNLDLLELVCLWSNEIGTTDIWYRFLNAGLPVMPSAGTDVMMDLHRTMALGTTRAYVRPEGALTPQSYMAALGAGRSFVTTGPLINFQIQRSGRNAAPARPGDMIPATRGRVRFTVSVHSALPLDSVNLVINGKTVSWLGRMPESGVFRGGGQFNVPVGGWIGIRVVGPAVTEWPSMAAKVFAHTAPVWIGSRGSTEPVARRAAATDLLRALRNAEDRLIAGYGEGEEIPALRAHFAAARARLDSLARPPGRNARR
jgi:TolB protein